MNLTAKPRRSDMDGHANQYLTSSATGWWKMGTGWRGAANTVIDLVEEVQSGLSGCILHLDWRYYGGIQKLGIIRGHWDSVSALNPHILSFCSAIVQLTIYSKMSWRLLFMATFHLCFVYPPVHAITVCSLVAARKDQCKQSRWKAYGGKDITLYHSVLQTCWALFHCTRTVDAAWQPHEQQTCHSVVNYVTRKVTLCKGWEGGGNELRV